MTTTIIGLGLIGGSLSLDLKRRGFTGRVIGVDKNPDNAKEALRLGLADEIMELKDALNVSDLVILAIPVKDIVKLLPQVLDGIRSNAVVTDMGSTKKEICEAVAAHPRRNRYVPSHPIAGTENSGPSAALHNLFDGKMAILCDVDRSDKDAVATVERLYHVLRMRLIYMQGDSHDMHVAYVSHISHITSFVLATTVLEIEKSTATIFDLAGSGFASTVRLGKSSPDMWAPIFEQNSKYISEALDAYIKNMKAFKDLVDRKDTGGMHKTMKKANEIRRILEGIKVVQ